MGLQGGSGRVAQPGAPQAGSGELTRVALGLAIAALGAAVAFRPLSSLTALTVVVVAGLAMTGVVALVGAGARQVPAPRLVGGAWVAAAVGVAAWAVWPGLSTDAVARVVGISLVAGGALDVFEGWLGSGAAGRSADRLATAAGGVASVVFGVLALAWPDVTLLVVGVVFGFRLVLVGLQVAWEHRPGARLVRLARPYVALVLALVLAAVTVQLNRSDAVLDAFYDTPESVPTEPGVLLRSESFDRAIPDGAQAWRILYTTTDGDDAPAVASGITVVPETAAVDPRPVIAWAHGTTGVARRCAPSALRDPWTAGALFVLDEVVHEGWALVATDYIGLGAHGAHRYLVGEPAAHAVLDAVRAARQLEEVELADEVVVWGHSQGGGAALWTGVVAPTYAPNVDVAGVAALAPASDLVGLMDGLETMIGGSLFASYAVWGYANAYDDVRVEQYVRGVGRTTFDQTVRRCLDARVLATALSSLTVGMDIFRADLTSGSLVERLAENVPTGASAAPVLVAQGEADELVLPTMQAAYVAARCAAGHEVEYRTYPGLGHIDLVQADSPLIDDLVAWTAARLAGEAPTSTC